MTALASFFFSSLLFESSGFDQKMPVLQSLCAFVFLNEMFWAHLHAQTRRTFNHISVDFYLMYIKSIFVINPSVSKQSSWQNCVSLIWPLLVPIHGRYTFICSQVGWQIIALEHFARNLIRVPMNQSVSSSNVVSE